MGASFEKMEIKLSFDNQTYDSEAALVEPDTKATSDYTIRKQTWKSFAIEVRGSGSSNGLVLVRGTGTRPITGSFLSEITIGFAQ